MIVTSTGKPASSLPWYTFRYIWEPKDAPKHVGVMAQEVLEVMPEAVVLDPSGFYRVNYDMIHHALAAENSTPTAQTGDQT